MIGPYKVASTLGAGGMGTVVKASDPQGQTVAIKMIGGTRLKGTSLIRARKRENSRIGLIREARLAAELRHPNIVEIYDIGQNKGALYVVMELLEGEPLNLYLRTHAVSAPEALRIVSQLCDALEHAHNHGVIHRDIKPENLFITGTGAVKVLDFGLALPPDESGPLGAIIGTPYYMSPEQTLGKDVDRRTDLWSAGVTLFQLLTARMPFQGRTTAELFGNIRNSPRPKLPFAGPFAQELNGLMDKALAKDRGARYASAKEFAADLRAVLVNLQANAGAFAQDLTPAKSANECAPATSRIAVHPAYTSVELGFREALKGSVFIPDASAKKGHVDAICRGFPRSWKALMPLAWTILLGGIGLVILAVLVLLAILFGLFVVVPMAIFEFVFPPPFFRCRSCRRRMRSVSAWTRPTWLSEQGGFCEPDCVAALKSGMWEEAVKLLWIYTSDEKSERRYKLEFFECAKCRDQRAYLTREILFDGGWGVERIREAYRFGIAENAHRFLAQNQLSAQSKPKSPASIPAATSAPQAGANVHDQPTT